jgi:hypothetical protein
MNHNIKYFKSGTPMPDDHFSAMSKREVVVTVRFPAREWSEEYVIARWRSLLNGFDGEPTVERIGGEFEMCAYFFYPEEGARFAALLTNLTGVRAVIEVKPPAN